MKTNYKTVHLQKYFVVTNLIANKSSDFYSDSLEEIFCRIMIMDNYGWNIIDPEVKLITDVPKLVQLSKDKSKYLNPPKVIIFEADGMKRVSFDFYADLDFDKLESLYYEHNQKIFDDLQSDDKEEIIKELKKDFKIENIIK